MLNDKTLQISMAFYCPEKGGERETGRGRAGHIKEQLDETYMKCENLIITCCTNASITVGHQGLLLLRVVADGRHVMGAGAKGRGISPKLHILRVARQTHLTALRLTQNKAASKLSKQHKEGERKRKVERQRKRGRESETALWPTLTAAARQHPAAFPQQAPTPTKRMYKNYVYAERILRIRRVASSARKYVAYLLPNCL